MQDHLNFSGLGGRSALAGQNDPRSHQDISQMLDQVWTSLLPPGGRIQSRLERGHSVFGNQLGLASQVATPPNNQDREGVSAEVGAPHEVTPTELVMLAKMGATVMGKV